MTSTMHSTVNARLQEGQDLFLSQDELLHLSRLVTVGELSACFAHEVFNPLMMIRGHLRLIEELIAENDPLRSHFDVVDRSSRRIEDLARRMLDFSRKRTPQLEYCEMRELIQDAMRFVQPYMHSRTAEIQLNIKRTLPEISVDRWQFVQAFVNLMQNAADAMVGCSRRVLTVSAAKEGKEMRVTFADTGKG